MELPHRENTPLSSTQQLIMYENFHLRGQVPNEEMYINIIPPMEESRSVGHSNHDQRRVRCPVTCTVRCQDCVSVLCLAMLCMLLLVGIAILSIINRHLQNCLTQREMLCSYTSTHLQLHNSSLTDTQ